MRVMEKEGTSTPLGPGRYRPASLSPHGHWCIRAIKELDRLTGGVTSAGAADAAAIKEQEDYTDEELAGGESSTLPSGHRHPLAGPCLAGPRIQ